MGTRIREMVESDWNASHLEECRYAAIIEDSKASIALHEKCGFRKIGYREKIAKNKDGEWKNTVLMEKRSSQIL